MNTRDRTPAHYGELRWSTNATDKIRKTFETFTTKIFATHFYHSFPREHEENEHANKGTQGDIAQKFYQNCYVKNVIKLRASTRASRTLEEVIFNKNYYEKRENVAWLTGRVGVGKSSAICHWLHENAARIRDEHRLFVRIDIDKQLPQAESPSIEQLPSRNQFIHRIAERIRQAVKSHFGQDSRYPDFENEYNCTTLSDPDAIADICKIVISVYGYNLTIILDNLDYLVYTHDRYLFCEDYKSNEMAKFESRVNEYLDCFEDERMNLVKGFSLLVVSRDSSESWLRRCDVADRVFGFKYYEFEIEPVKPFDVILAHYKLMRIAAYGTSTKLLIDLAKSAESEFIEKLKTEKNYSEDLQTALWLSGDGLRGIVKLANFLLIPLGSEILREYHEDFVAASRVLEHEYLMPQVVMLNRKVRYSQRYSDFPNLFMINSKRRPEDEKRVGKHRVTYWLKVFILLYISKWDKIRENIPIDDVNPEEHFCNLENIEAIFCTGQKSYPPPLVRVTVGSMFSTAGSGLITSDNSVNRSEGDEIRSLPLKLTDRGETILEGINGDSLDSPRRAYDYRYLELVVEDFDMPIPNELLRDFHYKNVDYAYFCEYRDVIVNRAIMKEWKRPLVTKLFELLHFALIEELAAYDDVVARLKKQQVINGNGSNFLAAIDFAKSKSLIGNLDQNTSDRIKLAVKRVYGLEHFDIKVKFPTGEIPFA